VKHAQWLAGRDGASKDTSKDALDGSLDEYQMDSLIEGKGRLSSTSSHLFKLILPLNDLTEKIRGRHKKTGEASVPIVFLLHPTQPMSHVGRLVSSSLPHQDYTVSFRSVLPNGRELQWSDSTDIADFVRDAVRTNEFTIRISRQTGGGRKEGSDAEEHTMVVEVPTFADRTRFLRVRLTRVTNELAEMDVLKRACDKEARQGAKRVAIGGLGMLLVYWGTVARLTFWDFGWDVMEPITYLSGLSTVIIGYLWFLYRGREVTYTSVLDNSIVTRRQALYHRRGFDIERWNELLAEERTLRKEIAQIARDYDRNSHEERESISSNDSRKVEDSGDTSDSQAGIANDEDPGSEPSSSKKERAVLEKSVPE